MKTPYEVLGLDKATATPETIKRAYRKKAAKIHPDNLETGDAEAFRPVVSAYKLLSDPQSKKIYDETGIAMGQDKGLEAAIALLVEISLGVIQEKPLCNLPKEIAVKLSSLSELTAAAIASMEQNIGTIEKRWRGESFLRSSVLMTLRARIAALETTKMTHARAKQLLDEIDYDCPAFSATPLDVDQSLLSIFGRRLR